MDDKTLSAIIKAAAITLTFTATVAILSWVFLG